MDLSEADPVLHQPLSSMYPHPTPLNEHVSFNGIVVTTILGASLYSSATYCKPLPLIIDTDFTQRISETVWGTIGEGLF
jgi:hypothetical protein